MKEKEYIFVGNAQLKTRDYIKQLEKNNRGKDKEIERLNNIIKEVREYIKSNEKEYGSLEDNEKIILKILDKAGDEK